MVYSYSNLFKLYYIWLSIFFFVFYNFGSFGFFGIKISSRVCQTTPPLPKKLENFPQDFHFIAHKKKKKKYNIKFHFFLRINYVTGFIQFYFFFQITLNPMTIFDMKIIAFSHILYIHQQMKNILSFFSINQKPAQNCVIL